MRASYLRQLSDGWIRLDADRDRHEVAADEIRAAGRGLAPERSHGRLSTATHRGRQRSDFTDSGGGKHLGTGVQGGPVVRTSSTNTTTWPAQRVARFGDERAATGGRPADIVPSLGRRQVSLGAVRVTARASTSRADPRAPRDPRPD